MFLWAFDEWFCRYSGPVEGSKPGANEESYESPHCPLELRATCVADELLEAFDHFHTEGGCFLLWVLASSLALADLACNAFGLGDCTGVLHDPRCHCVKVERRCTSGSEGMRRAVPNSL